MADGDEQAGGGEVARVEVDVSGCDAHDRPDPECVACLSKWGLTLATPNRAALLHPNALAARFRPGRSGNPKGRPKQRSMEEVVRSLLDEEVRVQGANGEVVEVSRTEALAQILLAQAIRPRPERWAVELLVTRLWPAPAAGVNINAQGAVTVVFDDQDRRELEGPDDEVP